MTIYTPNEKSFEGALFVSKESILELNKIIKEIDKEIYVLYENDLNDRVLENLKFSWNKDKNEEDMKNEFLSEENRKKITIITKDKYEIELSDLDCLIKDKSFSQLEILEIQIEVGYKYKTVSINISKESYSSFRYRARDLPEDIKLNIFYKLDTWYENFSGNGIENKWYFARKYLSYMSKMIICTLLIFLIANTLGHSRWEQYQNVITQELKSLYKKGFETQDDVKNVITLLIQNESKIIPPEFVPYEKPNFNKVSNYLILATILFLIIIMTAPETCFEVGKNQKKFKRQQKWKKLVLVIIPTSIILPIIIGVIVNYIS